MNVLEVLNSYPGEPFILEHAKALLGYADVKLCWAFVQSQQTGTLPKPLSELQCCFAIPNFNRLSKWKKLSYYFATPFISWEKSKKLAVLRSVAKTKPDIVHFHFATTAIKWAWIAEELRIPFTFSVRGSDVQVAPNTIDGYTHHLKAVGEKAAGVHAVCLALKKEFCELTSILPSKVKVIRTTLSNNWSTIERSPKKGLLLSVGRLHWCKGYPDLLLAAHLLQRESVDFNLRIIGEGPDRRLLEYMIRDLGLEKRVKLEGKKTHLQLREYLSHAHVFILSSLQEGFPNALGEAMQASVPFVVTDCGGIREVVEGEAEMYIAQAGDPQSLKQAILKAIKHYSKDLLALHKEKSIICFSKAKHAKLFTDFFNALV